MKMPYLTKWLLVEIITFYGLIVSAIAYLLIAGLLKFKRTNLVKKSEEIMYGKVDFIEATHNLYFYFGLSAT